MRLAVAVVACLLVSVIVAAALSKIGGRAAATASRHRPVGHAHTAKPVQHPTALAPLSIGAEGAYRVARRSLVFVEPARPNRSKRVLRVTVRFPIGADVTRHVPVSGGLFPLIVFAPGFRQCAKYYEDLLSQWAGAGYVVAAVDFPRTSCSVSNPDEADLSNQPADVAFVIKQLLALSREPESALHGLVAPAEIALAGHSDGGDTVAAMAGAQCCRDPEIRAVVVLAGAEWPPLGPHWFTAPAPPMMFVQGTADTWNFPAASLQLYQADTVGKRYYLDLPGADHFAPYQGDGQPEPIVATVTLDFMDYYLLGQRGRLGSMWQASRVRGKAVLVTGSRMPP